MDIFNEIGKVGEIIITLCTLGVLAAIGILWVVLA